MNKLYKYISVVAVALSATACADLDMENDGRLSMSEIFNRYDRTINYFGTTIGEMPKVTLTYGGTTTPMLAGFCDEAQDANDGQTHVISNWYRGYCTPNYNPLTSKCIDPWKHYFQAIYTCNNFLKNIQDPSVATYPFDEILKNGWIAQVKVARAFYYWQIIKRYGGVPLSTEPYPMDFDYSTARRASFEECANFLLKELDEALACPESEEAATGFRWIDPERAHPTRFLAHALKSEIALYAASPLHNPDQTGTFTWEYAAQVTKAALDACVAHGAELYSKSPEAGEAINCYDTYFITRSDPTRSSDKETIWASNTRLKIWSYAGTPMNSAMVEAGPCPSQELVDCYDMADGTEPILGYRDENHLQPIVNSSSTYDEANPYEDRDPRFYASIYYNGCQRNLDNPNSILYTYVGGNCGISDRVTDVRYTRTGYYIRKFNKYTSDGSHANDGYMPIFRLAELYLNFAEAAYQSAGPDANVGGMTAREAVNKVRARVGMPGLPSGMNKADFERRYRKERRVELAFEDHRFYDVRRWKILEETDKFVTGMKIIRNADGSYEYNRIRLADRGCAESKFYLYPIVQSEISKMMLHTGVNWQNPGWTNE